MNKCFLPTILFLAGLAAGQTAPISPAPSPIVAPAPVPPPSSDTAPQEPKKDPVEAATEALTLQQRVGQLMIVTLKGLYGPNSDDRAFLSKYSPGGVIISVGVKPEDTADYIKTLREMPIERTTGIPLLIGTDLYGLTRHGDGPSGSFIQLPSLLTLGATGDSESAEGLAKLLAEHLDIMGFNLSVGPSLVLSPTLPNAEGSLDTLGGIPEMTAQIGSTLAATIGAKGLLVMPMGFPGGGLEREGNSPAVLLTPKTALANKDLAPYKATIAAGGMMVHVSDTLVPSLDPENRPACLSPAVMRTVLREELGFKGIAVAGPIDSPDVKRLYPSHEASVLAFKSGADMLLWNDAGPNVMKAIENVAYAVQSGVLPESVINAAFERVLKLKIDSGLGARPLPDGKKAAGLAKKHRFPEEAYAIERRAITLVQNRGDLLPLSESDQPIGVTGVTGVEDLVNALEKHIKHISQQPITTARHVGAIEDFEIARLTSRARTMRTAICVFSKLTRMEGVSKLIRELRASGTRVVAVYLGYPDAIPFLSDADAILLAYSGPAQGGQSIRAVADIIAGNAPVEVNDSLKELHVQAGKTETFDIMKIVRSPVGRLPVSVAGPFVAGFGMSFDPSRVVKKVEWDFGDGTRANTPRVEHGYGQPGQYDLGITAIDLEGRHASGLFHVIAE